MRSLLVTVHHFISNLRAIHAFYQLKQVTHDALSIILFVGDVTFRWPLAKKWDSLP
jgi:hypothetical protein